MQTTQQPPAELRTTRVPDSWETQDAERKAQRDFTPVRALLSERRQKYIWMCIAVLSLLAGTVAPVIIVGQYEAAKSRVPFVFMLDGAGTIHAGPMEHLNLQSEIFRTTALNAAQAALQRSPVGLDLPELVNGIFRPDAQAKLKKDVEAQMPDIKARSLHQKPEIEKITALSENAGMRVLEVRGQLVRAGNLDGTPISDPSIPFQLVLAIMQNPRMNERGQYPFIVTDFKLRVDR